MSFELFVESSCNKSPLKLMGYLHSQAMHTQPIEGSNCRKKNHTHRKLSNDIVTIISLLSHHILVNSFYSNDFVACKSIFISMSLSV